MQIASGMLGQVRQLGIEFHWYAESTLEQYQSAVSYLKALEDSGMIRFDSKANIFWQESVPSLNYTGPMGFEIAWYQLLPFS